MAKPTPASKPDTSPSHFVHDADPIDGVYDELRTSDGELRPHYVPFVESLKSLGAASFQRRWKQAERSVYENGIAFGGYNSEKDVPRRWELDPLPMLIPAKQWESISSALQQRAQVLNLTLADLFGEQRLLKEGILPPELVFPHPGFLRACHGLSLPNDDFLHFYSADIARSPDGQWWVMADRTEAPSGMGYALENRIVTSRMLPELFQSTKVARLAPFFMAYQEYLEQLCPAKDNLHIALLSHGPSTVNYFEDAYLASYLGYTLVEAGDLAVRNDRVMLKTLAGLVPVDVILRNHNSHDTDPLELGPSTGIGGITHSARLGNVFLSNPFGSGIVESSATMAFLPALCEFFLDEELSMPNIATWWCGQPKEMEHVLENLDDLVVQPAFRRRGKDGPERATLANLSRADLADLIRSNPAGYVARERVTRSSIPIQTSDGAVSQHVALRAFVTATADSYQVMKGALARVTPNLEPLEISIRAGERSKDVWVLSEKDVSAVSLLSKPGKAIELRRGGSDLPSRVADHVFWLGRQLERAESATRLLRTTVERLTGETSPRSVYELPMLLRCMADQGQIEPGYVVPGFREQLPVIEAAIAQAVFDREQPGCLRGTLDELFRIGSVVRDRLSQDTWRSIRHIDEVFRPPVGRSADLPEILAMANRLITELTAFGGHTIESMTRTHSFYFLDLGRKLERSRQMIALIKSAFVPLPTAYSTLFPAILEIADSAMTYRSRYHANMDLTAVLDLLLTDETNPRSLAYQFAQIAEHVDQLPRDSHQASYALEQRLAVSLLASIRILDIREVAESHSLGGFDRLATTLDHWETQLPRLAETLSLRYLVHSGPLSQLGEQ